MSDSKDRLWSDEFLTEEFMDEVATRCEYTWNICGTDIHVYYNTSGVRKGFWQVFRVGAGEEEISYGYVLQRDELANLVDVIEQSEDCQEDDAYPHWALMSESARDRAIRMAR